MENNLNNLLGFGPQYPTKEEIMEEPWPTHKRDVIRSIVSWKKEIWKDAKYDSSRKARALIALVRILGNMYDKPCGFAIEENAPSPRYDSATETIYMNESMSIISTLHEFAHHLYGSDEIKACRWSVHLFRKTFPRAYNQLVWQGHCLVRPN